ncbi:MAG: YlxR family protein [Thermoleophilia bacterium]|jgi:predicted RNA-binding protein YlxR (DUF448 family)
MPERTCVGCRQRHPQDELVRFVATNGHLRLAGEASPGRGAYVCVDQACFTKAQARRAFSHALHQSIEIDSSVGEAFAQVCLPKEKGGEVSAEKNTCF